MYALDCDLPHTPLLWLTFFKNRGIDLQIDDTGAADALPGLFSTVEFAQQLMRGIVPRPGEIHPLLDGFETVLQCFAIAPELPARVLGRRHPIDGPDDISNEIVGHELGSSLRSGPRCGVDWQCCAATG